MARWLSLCVSCCFMAAAEAFVPNTFHRVWVSPKEIPPKWQQAHQVWLDFHPEWEVMMWNVTTCRQLIATHYEWFLEQWDEYAFPIQHADVCRYFVLHRYGGLYADLDIRPLRSLKPFLEEVANEGKEVRLLEKDQSDFAEVMCIGLMASVPGAPFWDAVFTTLQHRRYRWFYHLSPHLRIIMSTGPQAVMPVVKAKRHRVGVFPAKQFYACGPCSALPCQREGGWVAFEEGGLSWNRWDTMILNALDCYVSHPFICVMRKYTVAMAATLTLLTLAVGSWVLRRALADCAPRLGRWPPRRWVACLSFRRHACHLKRVLKVAIAALLVFVGSTFCMLQGSTRLVGRCRPRLCEARQRVLLVTAHPDDESMFFAPTLQHCVARASEVHVLCLSRGDAEGLGRVREGELRLAAGALGLTRVEVVDDPALPDGPMHSWESSAIQRHVQAYIVGHNISSVVTFDEDGVSRHPNHLAVHAALVELHRARHRRGTQFYQLDSVSLVRKFAGVFDLPLSLFDSFDGELFLGSLRVSWAAMQQHSSQFVWYRWLFVLFSRYTYMNTLRNFNTVLYPRDPQCTLKGQASE